MDDVLGHLTQVAVKQGEGAEACRQHQQALGSLEDRNGANAAAMEHAGG